MDGDLLISVIERTTDDEITVDEEVSTEPAEDFVL